MMTLSFLWASLPFFTFATQIPFQQQSLKSGSVNIWDSIDPSMTDSQSMSVSGKVPPIRTIKKSVTRPKSLNLKTYHSIRHARWKSRVALRSNDPMMIVEAFTKEKQAWEDWGGWEDVEMEVPDASDWGTLKGLAMMTSNAYWEHPPVNGTVPPGWFDLGEEWEVKESFGWDGPMMRGHLFATKDNSIVVMAIKGTSAGIVGGGGDTSSNDKFNDNLLFSCCCARVDWTWTPVCGCYKKGGDGYQCSGDCVEDAVMNEGSYYPTSTELFENITSRYPDSQIWMTGHSLGGGLAALIALTFGIPAVTFEAPGELMAARRLHLPLPPPKTIANESFPMLLPYPEDMRDWYAWSTGKKHDDNDPLGNGDFGYAPIIHIYHTADPIPMGVCTGVLSSCSLAGFALESRCHAGKTILFDTVSQLGWSVDIRTHPINQIINKVLDPETWRDKSSKVKARSMKLKWRWPWNGQKDKNDDDDNKEPPLPEVPDLEPELDCEDCFRWNYSHPDEGKKVVGGNT